MARKVQISIIASALVLCLGAAGAWAWDSSQADQIAKGVSVSGVDVGGRSAEAAKARIRREVAAPLERDTTVRWAGHTYPLPAKRLQMHADVEGMVDDAKEASRSASLPARLWRYASGGSVNEDVPPRVGYSRPELGAFIAEIEEKINRKPLNASVSPGPSSVDPVQSKSGVEVDADQLRDGLEAALQDPVGSRVVRAKVERTEPDVTTAELAAKYPAYITVNRGAFQLSFFRNLKLVRTYPIAVGMVGLETPAGVYNIQNKGVDVAWQVPNSAWAGDLAGKVVPGGSADNPLKARWMGIYSGAGIHGTDATYSLGSNASHGCIRMAIPDVIELYDQVSVGTPVYVGN